MKILGWFLGDLRGAAPEPVFSRSNPSDSWGDAVRSLRIGKRIGGRVYLHRSALSTRHVPHVLLNAIHRAQKLAKADFDVVSVSVDRPWRVSLTSYPGFMREKFPAIEHAWTVDLRSGTVHQTHYSHDSNRPILHRKEQMLAPDHPDRERFAAVTRRGEAAGVFHDMSGMGTEQAWRDRLAKAGVRLNPTGYSADTSLAQVPALHKTLERSGVWARGDLNADLGGGAYDLATKYLKQRGVRNLVYDPGNRSENHNERVLSQVTGGRADTVTIANTLNVIPSSRDRADLLRLAADAVRPGGQVFISIYEGDKSGHGRETTKGWQANRTLASYLPEVRRVLPGAIVERGMIAATKE